MSPRTEPGLEHGRPRASARPGGGCAGRAVRRVADRQRVVALADRSTGSAGGAAGADAGHRSVRPCRQGPAGQPGRGPAAWSAAMPGAPAGAGVRPAGGTFTVTGSGDIAPEVPAAPDGGGGFADRAHAARRLRRPGGDDRRRGDVHDGRVPPRADPGHHQRRAPSAAGSWQRRRSSSARSASRPAWSAALPRWHSGSRLLRSNGNYILPVSTGTEIRVVAGTAALLAITAIMAVALGALLRSSAATVTIVSAAVVLPYVLATTGLPPGAANWVLRVSPAAAFAIQQSVPQNIRRWRPAVRPRMGISRSRRGPAWPCCAATPSSRSAWRSSRSGGGTHVSNVVPASSHGAGRRGARRPAPPGPVAEHARRAARGDGRSCGPCGARRGYLLAVAAATIVLGLVADAAARCSSAYCQVDPARISLTGIYLSQAVVAVLAVQAISSECGSGMIRTTFTAMPRRSSVLTAKAVILVVLILAAGVVAVLALGARRRAHPARPRLHNGAGATRRCRWLLAPSCARRAARF